MNSIKSWQRPDRAFSIWTDVSCGVTFLSFDNLAQLDASILDQYLTPGSYALVDGSSGHGNFRLLVGKRERKSTVTGGLKIWSGSSASESRYWCTSNVVWRKGTSEKWLASAGHCAQASGTMSNSGPSQVNTVSGQTWYQGQNGATSTNQVSLGNFQYFWFGGPHDVLAIQLSGSRSAPTPTNLTHESVQQGPNGPFDFYKNLNWWYWNTTLDTAPGLLFCTSNYTWGIRSCGTLDSIVTRFEPAADTFMPWSTYITDLRRMNGMIACFGDSGGTVWAEQANGDNNIDGILHGGEGPVIGLTNVEGNVMECKGNILVAQTSFVRDIGLTAPWDMS